METALVVLYCSIDAEESDRLCQMVNDAPDRDVNTVMKLKVFSDKEYLCLFAVKNIEPGEELLYNYGDEENLWWRNKVTISEKHGMFSISDI